MPTLGMMAYAYLVGTSASACVGSFIEWRSGLFVGMKPPFVTHHHILRSLALVAAAGPYLLIRELGCQDANSRLSSAEVIAGIAAATAWALALGILLVESGAFASSRL